MMHKIVPDVSIQPPQERYDYFDLRGLPFAGEPGLMREVDYRARVSTVAKAGFGNFDTAKPEQQHFGRTLHEVLVKANVGIYKILTHREQWVTCPKYGVRVLQFVQWIEYSDRANSETLLNTSTNQSVKNFMRG